ncbi:GTPase [Kitasatospora purpeofusca]|uniref:GTPase n=1 Tax=Kitasatospora purpeofusca TaxID=67352 RepID=UPI00224D787D|nr:GTPase [Kitasatospora purpeofusca]MCX4755644.1 50S ribosome-binding GTPase [Kitasatospora purpeofusca]WSR36493.1 50S ribosome-binding GTPase [Kitasatospora purpeofusca]WSR44776.1 50S ribosome-binding GTPase [Kitasatospora purpeofusca]
MTAAPPQGGELAPLVAGFTAELERLLPPGPPAAAVRAVRERLAGHTLRIAVGGRMNAGKSTLVNALLGRRLAASAATECTTVVAWFRPGPLNRIQVRHRDGSAQWRPGGLPRDPRDLGLPVEQIAEVVVEAAGLRPVGDCELVDTPGLDSLSGLDGPALDALARADAMIYVMPHPGAGDAEALGALRAQADGRMTALNAVGVLSRIDLLGEGHGDPWPRARQVAATNAGRLAGLVDEVLPVVGLLAQTALGDDFTEPDAALVRRLVEAPAGELRRARYSGRRFLDWDTGPLTRPERERLFGLLGVYGIDTALAAARRYRAEGRPIGAAALLAEFRAASGITAVVEQVRRRFVDSADVLRSAAALGAVEAALGAGEDLPADLLRQTRARIGELRRHPELRRHELARALAAVAGRRLELDQDSAEALIALATGRTPAARLRLPEDTAPGELRRAAAGAARDWRRLEDGPLRDVGRYARIARELCEAIYFATPPEGTP